MPTEKLKHCIDYIKSICKDPVYTIVIIVLMLVYVFGAIGTIQMDNSENLSYDLETATEQSIVLTPQSELTETMKVDGQITSFTINHSVAADNAEFVDIKVFNAQGENIVSNIISTENQTDIQLQDYDKSSELTLVVKNLSDTEMVSYEASREKSIGAGNGDFVIKKQINYIMYSDYTNVRILFLFILIACFVLLVKFQKDAPNNVKVARILCIVILLCIILIRYTNYLFNGYSYYEYWGLYIDKANTYGLDSLLIADAGYLPLFNRILTIAISWLPVGRGIQCFIINVFAIGFILYVLTRFVSEAYSHILPYRDRILVVLLFACTLQNEQMIILLNYTYFTGLLIFLIYLQDFDALSLKERIRDIALSIFLASKVALLGFLPPVCIILLYDIVKKNKYRIFQSIACIIVSLIQVFYLLQTDAISKTTGNIFCSIVEAVKSFAFTLGCFLFQNFDYSNYSYKIDMFFLAGIVMIIALISLIYLLKRHTNIGFAYLLIYAAAYIMCFLNIMSTAIAYFGFTNYDVRYRLGNNPDGGYTKNIFLVICFVCCTILICLYIVSKKVKIQRARIVVYTISLILLFPTFRIVYADSTGDYSANYEIYNKVDEVWAVPLDTAGTFSVKESLLGKQEASYIGYFGNGDLLVQNIGESIVYGVTEPVLTEGYSISEIDSMAVESANNLASKSVAMYCVKLFEGQRTDIYLTCYDKNNNVIQRYKAIDSNNFLLTFILDSTVLHNVNKICIEDEEGNLSSVKNAMWVCGENRI